MTAVWPLVSIWDSFPDPNVTQTDPCVISRVLAQPIELTDLENGGLCDIQSFSCRSVRVFGLGFIDSSDLSCHATRLKVMWSRWDSWKR